MNVKVFQTKTAGDEDVTLGCKTALIFYATSNKVKIGTRIMINIYSEKNVFIDLKFHNVHEEFGQVLRHSLPSSSFSSFPNDCPPISPPSFIVSVSPSFSTCIHKVCLMLPICSWA